MPGTPPAGAIARGTSSRGTLIQLPVSSKTGSTASSVVPGTSVALQGGGNLRWCSRIQ